MAKSHSGLDVHARRINSLQRFSIALAAMLKKHSIVQTLEPNLK